MILVIRSLIARCIVRYSSLSSCNACCICLERDMIIYTLPVWLQCVLFFILANVQVVSVDPICVASLQIICCIYFRILFLLLFIAYIFPLSIFLFITDASFISLPVSFSTSCEGSPILFLEYISKFQRYFGHATFRGDDSGGWSSFDIWSSFQQISWRQGHMGLSVGTIATAEVWGCCSVSKSQKTRLLFAVPRRWIMSGSLGRL